MEREEMEARRSYQRMLSICYRGGQGSWKISKPGRRKNVTF
jgi:hypothetical protein